MIAGLQKMTLLDYPGKVACTVFLQGCNFRCPFCHNSGLLGSGVQQEIPEETLLAFLEKRKGLLDGVCITGGEPTLYSGLGQLLEKIKAMGFAIKLDTNGSRPQVLKAVVKAGLVDYVAMDIKNCPERYGLTAGVQTVALDAVEESICFLLSGNVDYEFRTTVVREFHDEGAMEAVGTWLRRLDDQHPAKRFYLQPYVDRESVLAEGLHAPQEGNIRKMAEILEGSAALVEIRAMG